MQKQLHTFLSSAGFKTPASSIVILSNKHTIYFLTKTLEIKSISEHSKIMNEKKINIEKALYLCNSTQLKSD